MSLQDYYSKRDFSASPEPKGEETAGTGASYVIQKHAARRLHYDFRLEVDGVLKSWAVPKGPSLNPKEKRLAVETEDHPVAYADFEGVIPKPHYGAGTVMLWDVGEWAADGDVAKSLKSGKLSFFLHGNRLQGRWTLVRMKSGKTSGKEWLLVKDNDEFAEPESELTDEYTQSVVSDRSMAAIEKAADHATKNLGGEPPSEREGGDRSHMSETERKSSNSKHKEIETKLEALQDEVSDTAKSHEKRPPAVDFKAKIADLSGARLSAFPESIKPQLATLYTSVPEGDDWLHEIKYDGYRLLAMRQSQLRLLTRNGKDWTKKSPEIVKRLQDLPESVVDGELVYLGANGISNFEGLQNALSTGATARLIFYIFDIPYLEGYDLTEVPLLERKKLLASLVDSLNQDQIRYSEHIEGKGNEVYEHACQHGLEGIISKQAESRYVPTRTKTWRKIKCAQRQELVIVGFTAPRGSRTDFGALLLGFYQKNTLRYAGKVGTGFSARQLRGIGQKLRERIRQRSPLGEDVDESEVTWVKPDLVAEVAFTQWTAAKRLRHPAFLGLREDKPAQQVVRETAQDGAADADAHRRTQEEKTPARHSVRSKRRVSAQVAGVSISHPDKVLYEKSGITKGDLAEYYASVAEYLLPYVKHRPLTLVRCPQGHARHCFFQKHLSDAFSEAVKPIEIEEKNGTVRYAYIEKVNGLVELVQMGTLELHTWGSKIDQLEKPDVLVFDLDPGEGVAWEQIQRGARDVREYLSSLGLSCFLRTSGGKGLHVVVPISRRHDWVEAKAFAKAVAQEVMQNQPNQYVVTASKAKRKGKIFIDYLRNGRGATSVCSYSTRAKPGAPIATPLAWDELDDLESSQTYTLGNMGERLGTLDGDPWADFHNVRQSITRKMQRELGLHR